MTPKQNAGDLFQKYYHSIEHYLLPEFSVNVSVLCALMAVDEIMEELDTRKYAVDTNYLPEWNGSIYNYWLDTKLELLKLKK